MGVVYRALDLQMGRTVAVKLLPPKLAEDKHLLARFKNEILNTGQLDHPHIAKIYDIGEADGAYYYVMELIEGSDLRGELAKRKKYPLEEACRLLSEAASALDYAHEKGIIHRDIKPENLLIDGNGASRIVDFGIARAVGATRMTGGMIGTPEYISPEQARGIAVSGASDQYSLAVLAYEMLTGVPPFQTDRAEPWAIINKHISDDPPDPRTRVDDLPLCAANALLKALEKSPDDRFSTCRQFVEALTGDYLFSPRRRPKKASGKPSAFSPKMLLMIAIPIILLVAGLLLVVKPLAKSGNHSVPETTSFVPIDNKTAKDFVQNTWFLAWKAGQIGPFSKCYDNDNFVGHDYLSRSSFTTLTFDSYLSQWLSRNSAADSQITDLVAEKISDKQALATFSIKSGGSDGLHKRLTLGKGKDNNLIITHEDSAPLSVSLDGLE
jgi:serine/threonine protein kinase